jgi:hypothetical protein
MLHILRFHPNGHCLTKSVYCGWEPTISSLVPQAACRARDLDSRHRGRLHGTDCTRLLHTLKNVISSYFILGEAYQGAQAR